MIECIACHKKYKTLSSMVCPECFIDKIMHDEGIPGYVREYKFFDKRKWKFDFAWPDKKIAVEIEGGTWSGGRHTRGTGFENDCKKYNQAVIDGWRVLRYTTNMVENGEALNGVIEILGI